MKIYGYMALFMAILSTVMTFFQNPSWMIGGVFSYYLAWSFLAPEFHKKSHDSITNGKILSIRANGTFLGGPHQPLYDAEISYLDQVKKFKNLPPNFIHDISPGDIIEIAYNSRNPLNASVNLLNET